MIHLILSLVCSDDGCSLLCRLLKRRNCGALLDGIEATSGAADSKYRCCG